MFQLRFNQVWTGLLVAAAIAACVLPESAGDHVRGLVQNVFAPVARPVRVIGTSVRTRVVPAENLDDGAEGNRPRGDSILAAENQDLRIRTANLTEELAALKSVSRDRELLGAAKDFCTPVAVVGADSGMRESLGLEKRAGDEVKEGQVAICSTGIVGKVVMGGVGGMRVRLITDKDVRIEGRFARFTEDARYVPINTPTPLLKGTGKGEMVIDALTTKDVIASGLKVGDWVVIADRDWPTVVQGYKLGKVSEVTQNPNGPLHAQIWVKPTSDLMALREVMVVNKK